MKLSAKHAECLTRENAGMTSTDEALIPIRHGDGVTVVAPPGSGPGFWAGGPSAIATADGIYRAHRLRRPVDSGVASPQGAC